MSTAWDWKDPRVYRRRGLDHGVKVVKHGPEGRKPQEATNRKNPGSDSTKVYHRKKTPGKKKGKPLIYPKYSAFPLFPGVFSYEFSWA